MEVTMMMGVVVLLGMVSGVLGQHPAPSPATCDMSAAFGSLVPCLSYVQGTVKTPDAGCCPGLLTVLHQGPTCLCQLITQAVSGGAAGAGVNDTLALGLPQVCGIKGVNVKDCPGVGSLLGPIPAPSQGGETPPGTKGSPSGPSGSAYVSTPTIGVYIATLGVILML